jgi:threonine dehydratase
LLPLQGVSDSRIWIKLENLQPGGSYKLRGVYNRVALAKDEVKARGAKIVSSGNGAIALGIACRSIGAPFEVVMPESASQHKVEAVRALGGTVVLLPSVLGYINNDRELLRKESRVFIHPFLDPDVWAGHGTLAVEVLEDLPDLRTLLVPIGGGGLIIGVAGAVKALAPHVKVIGVQPAACPSWAETIRRNEPCSFDVQPTIADAIQVPVVLESVWSVARDLVDGCITVTEAEIRSAMRLLAIHNRVVAEGAGAVATAAALKLDESEGPVVAIVSGGNMHPTVLAEVLSEH